MSFIFDAINWKLKIMKKWLCKICFLWENKNRTVVIFLLVGLFVSLGFVYVLLVRNKRLNKENRLLQRQYEAVDNALFRMEEMQKTYLQYENMKKIDDIDLKTETDSYIQHLMKYRIWNILWWSAGSLPDSSLLYGDIPGVTGRIPGGTMC